MGQFIIIEKRAHDVTWAIEASSIDEARRAFVETGAGEQIDDQPYDDNGIVKIIDPCGETVEERLSPAEQAIRNIHELLDGTEWRVEFMDYIAGEVEGAGYKVRSVLTDCDLCEETAVEDTAPIYIMPIDWAYKNGEWTAEAGDSLEVCPDCQTAIEAEAERQRRGL